MAVCKAALQSLDAVRIPWEAMKLWLEGHDASSLAAFLEPVGSGAPDRQEAAPVGRAALRQRWLAGLDCLGHSKHALWELEWEARKAQANVWGLQMQGECSERLVVDLESIKALQVELRKLQSYADCQLLRQARVIACTIIGATKYGCVVRVARSVQLSPCRVSMQVVLCLAARICMLIAGFVEIH